MANYGPKAQAEVKEMMHEYKENKRSGKKQARPKSRKQAVAIGLSKARQAGAKVPRKKAA